MGLAIVIGYQADMKENDSEGYVFSQKQFARMAEVLEENGLGGQWAEPDSPTDFPEWEGTRPHSGDFSYSDLHYLRRAYAHTSRMRYLERDDPLEPVERLTEEDNERVMDETMMMSSHLLCHSDCEGYYVPVDFPEPIFDDRAPGGMLGSSFGLLRELREVAPTLSITLTEEGELSDEEAARLFAVEWGAPFGRELQMWLTLWELSRASVHLGTAIVFC